MYVETHIKYLLTYVDIQRMCIYIYTYHSYTCIDLSHVYIYINIYINTYTYIYTYIYIYIHIYTYI